MFNDILDFIETTNCEKVAITCGKDGDKLNVVVTAIHPHQDKPVSDEAKAALSMPLTMKGNPDDIEGGFGKFLKQYADNSKPNLDLLYTNASDAGNKKAEAPKDKKKSESKESAIAKAEAETVESNDPEEL